MAKARTSCQFVNGYPTLMVEGELKISTLYSLYLLVHGCEEQCHEAVILDLAEDVTISDEVKGLSREELGWVPNGVKLIISGTHEQVRQLQEILGPELIFKFAPDLKDVA